MDHINHWLKRLNRKGITLGITTRCPESSFRWLKDFLTEKFQDLILNVEYLPITNSNRYEWESKVIKYSAVILYHTKHQGRGNITDTDEGIYNEKLSYLCNKLGKEKVLVVLDDMEDTSDEKKRRLLETQPSLTRLSSNFNLTPETGKPRTASRKRGKFLIILGADQTSPCTDDQSYTRTKSDDNIYDNGILTNPKRAEKTQNLYEENLRSLRSKCRVGIFSRSGDDNYKWLVNSLQTASMKRSLDVRSISISSNYQSYYSEMSQCNFAILYHTKNQGRLNITDVTDSLYDRELKELSEFLGRSHVIVVVDDVMDTGNEEKKRILKNQPSISTLTQDLFLFSERYKNPETLRTIITLIQKSGAQENNDQQHQQPSRITIKKLRRGEADFAPCHTSEPTPYKSPESIYETRFQFQDIYSSQKSHNHSLQSHRHESFSTKKKQDSEKSSLGIVIDDYDTTDKVSWMENQLQVLNDSGSVFFMRLSEFNDAWRFFQQEKENRPSAIQQPLYKTHTQEAKLEEKDLVISNLRKRNLEEKEKEGYNLQRQIKEQQRMTEEKVTDVSHLQRQIKEQQRMTEEKVTDVYHLQRQIKDQQRMIEEKKTEVSHLQRQIKEQQRMTEEKETDVYHLQRQTKEQQRMIEEKKTEVSHLQRQIKEQQRMTEEKETDVYHLQRQTKEQQRMIEEKKTEVSHLQRQIKEQQRMIEEKKTEVSHLQRQIKEQQRMTEEKETDVYHQFRSVGKMQEGRSLERPEGNHEEIIHDMKKATMQHCNKIKKLQEQYQDQETLEELQGRKRRGDKKWVSGKVKEERVGSGLRPLTTEHETIANFSTLDGLQNLDDKPKTQYKHFLWHRITELESQIKELTYANNSQRGEIYKCRQTIKEQSYQINKYKEELDSLHDKTAGFGKYDAGNKKNRRAQVL